jgi:hypothetical protein
LSSPFLVDAWAEAVLHVLVHVRATAGLPASLYDAGYVAEVERVLGPADGRALGEDAAILGRVLPTHEALANAQRLAWLFRSAERAEACAGRDLAELGAADVDAPALLPGLAGDAAVEVLRAAAELELPLVALLPAIAVDLAALGRALDGVERAAPGLRGFRVGVARALGLRGRVMGDEIWVGAAPLEHAAWQAAHEATVAEVVAVHGEDGHYRVERAAIARLAARARAAGLERPHRAWLAHLGDDCSAAAARSGT